MLVPREGKRDKVQAEVDVHDFPVGGGREVLSEVVEIHLCGRPAAHPASVVLPLLISDLPAFCRWRGEPLWGSSSLDELVGVCDRLVVDSNEWARPAAAYARLVPLFDRLAVSDLAYRRTLGWKIRLAELWPGVRRVKTIEVVGPSADAELLAGWLRSRLGRPVDLRWTQADAVSSVTVDGAPVEAPIGGIPSGPDLLSAELDVIRHDRVYEGAVRATLGPPRRPAGRGSRRARP
jgi:glucose-6-phosphate dehydrogenase assembly protein OpcA